MAQARRKSGGTRKRTGGRSSGSSHGFGMLIAGIIIGAAGMALFQGLSGPASSSVGSGLKSILDASRNAENGESPQNATGEGDTPRRTKFDFYTVLPEIERVIPDPDPQDTSPAPPAPAPVQAQEPEPVEPKPASTTGKSFYMLQAASFKRADEAEKLKAELILNGFQAQVQEVSIQGQGQFFRVRLGPYTDTSTLDAAHRKLAGRGINAMRLKVSSL